MTLQEEIEHIDATLVGDLRAFEKLIHQHQEKALVIARSMIHDHDDAKDVVQESFIQAYKHLHNFNKDSRFYTWLHRIVINQSLKWLRKRKGSANVIAAYIKPSETVTANEGMRQLEAGETKEYLQSILAKMKPKEALMLNMHYLLEYSIKEIHESTGYSMSNIKVLLHRARASMRSIIEESKI